eukprot:TRINITY_DN1861_c0_g5_i1.p1 TRINITY_DN1861_c0_g5~~TRINITY_DN1861_c0_g5_i1.p1  ORF type:complete len:591 (+),score=238.33 TRINITY_DN1861_c0_g5_i1:61-1773(+)
MQFDSKVLEVVFLHCDADELKKLGFVCRRWGMTSRSDVVWRGLCGAKHGVVAKPANVMTWCEWYYTLQNGCASPSELLSVLKTQGERMQQMDQQYAAAMGTIKDMCEDRRASPLSASNGTRILQGHATRDEEERDGIALTSQGQVIFEEERATFVDASFDEDFVVRRVSSSPTAAAVLSPYRVTKVDPNRASSEPSVGLQATPEKSQGWSTAPPVLATPPTNDCEDMVTPPPRQESQAPMPSQHIIRSASPQSSYCEFRTNHLQYTETRHPPTPHVEQGDVPMDFADQDELAAYMAGVIQMQLEAEKSRVSSKLYKSVRQLLAENQSMRSMYNYQKSVAGNTMKQLMKEQKKNRMLQAKNIAIMSRLAESRRYVKKLKNTIVNSKVATLPLHNEIVARMNIEQATREEIEEVRAQADKFLMQRNQLYAELQAGSAKVVALEQVVQDMEKQHEANLADALNANANFSASTPLEKQNAALRVNLEGLQQVIQTTYRTNQDLKQQLSRVLKAAEETAGELHSIRTEHEHLIQQRNQEHEYWMKYEEKYIQQISTLHRALQQQQQGQGQRVSHP